MSTQDAYYVLVVKNKHGDTKGFVTSSHSICNSSGLAKTFDTYDDVINYIETFRKILFNIFPYVTFDVALVTTTITSITEYSA